MSHLERVTECEHGNIECRMYSNADYHTPCPGGSRVRVEPDLSAASNVLRRYVRVTTVGFGRLTELVVDAALTEDTPQ